MAKFLLVLALAAVAVHGASYSYEGETGPDNWAAISPKCGGNFQSPVNLENAVYRADLPPLEFIEGGKFGKMSISNNGHSLVATEADESALHVKGGVLPEGDERPILQFHFHWGRDVTEGSEHTVNGEAYPLELHMVHFDDSMGDTVVSSAHGLAVVGVFFKVGAFHEDLQKIIDQIPKITYKGQSAKLNKIIKQSSFIPASHATNYYTYQGSLTTPTCDQSVTWMVLAEPLEASAEQIAQFRTLMSNEEGKGEDEAILHNFRPVQPLNWRTIFSSFETEEAVEEPVKTTTPVRTSLGRVGQGFGLNNRFAARGFGSGLSGFSRVAGSTGLPARSFTQGSAFNRGGLGLGRSSLGRTALNGARYGQVFRP